MAFARHFYFHCLVVVQPRKRPHMTKTLLRTKNVNKQVFTTKRWVALDSHFTEKGKSNKYFTSPNTNGISHASLIIMVL